MDIANAHDLVEALKVALKDTPVDVWDGASVPLITIALPDAEYREGYDGFDILLSVGHNRDGWEAVIDTNGDQYALPDGPDNADASLAEIVAWVVPLVTRVLEAKPKDDNEAAAVSASFFKVEQPLVPVVNPDWKIYVNEGDYIEDSEKNAPDGLPRYRHGFVAYADSWYSMGPSLTSDRAALEPLVWINAVEYSEAFGDGADILKVEDNGDIVHYSSDDPEGTDFRIVLLAAGDDLASLPGWVWFDIDSAAQVDNLWGTKALIDDEDDEEVNMDTYKIVRFYRDDKPREVQQTGLTLEQAQAHCKDESTRGDGWFDGYESE